MLRTEFLLTPDRKWRGAGGGGVEVVKEQGGQRLWRPEYFWPQICNVAVGGTLVSPGKDVYVLVCCVRTASCPCLYLVRWQDRQEERGIATGQNRLLAV